MHGTVQGFRWRGPLGPLALFFQFWPKKYNFGPTKWPKILVPYFDQQCHFRVIQTDNKFHYEALYIDLWPKLTPLINCQLCKGVKITGAWPSLIDFEINHEWNILDQSGESLFLYQLKNIDLFVNPRALTMLTKW